MLSQPILELPDTSTERPIIKVFGVGGGGCNAVNYIYRQGISNVTFTVCNTDAQILRDSPVPTQLLLGEGLGAGTKVEVGQHIGEQHAADFREHLSDGTRMVFIATGLGGGTGTAVAPIVARIAREMGLLTIGVVTLPYIYEHRQRIEVALEGVAAMRQVTDALIVINNQRILSIYRDLALEEANAKVNEVLYMAVRSIIEIITRSLTQNADFNDVKTVLENGGFAVMNQVYTRGERRVYRALTDIVNSPLLDNRNIYDATRMLIVVRYPQNQEHILRTVEIDELHEFTQHFNSQRILCKSAFGSDPDLQDEVCVTLLASGFDTEETPSYTTADSDDWETETNEEKARREARYKAYYGTAKQHKPEPFIFRHVADLDNEALINHLAKQPAYKRTIMGNIELKRRFATAEIKALQEALTQPLPPPTSPEIITLDIDTGATYELH